MQFVGLWWESFGNVDSNLPNTKDKDKIAITDGIIVFQRYG